VSSVTRRKGRSTSIEVDLLSTVVSESVFEVVVPSLGARATRLGIGILPVLFGGFVVGFIFVTAPSFSPLPSFFCLLLFATCPVTSTSTSLFLLAPVASLIASTVSVFAFEASVEAVAREAADGPTVAPPTADLTRAVSRGRALAFSLSLFDRTTRVVFLVYKIVRISWVAEHARYVMQL